MKKLYEKVVYYVFCGLCVAYIAILGIGLVLGIMEMLCGE
tara:strand:- start:969 stop:1088 length:120 start_codon:yes stop_codon:yes gene_type:complete